MYQKTNSFNVVGQHTLNAAYSNNAFFGSSIHCLSKKSCLIFIVFSLHKKDMTFWTYSSRFQLWKHDGTKALFSALAGCIPAACTNPRKLRHFPPCNSAFVRLRAIIFPHFFCPVPKFADFCATFAARPAVCLHYADCTYFGYYGGTMFDEKELAALFFIRYSRAERRACILIADASATVCPRSSNPFYMVSYYIKRGTTFLTYSTHRSSCSCYKIY